MPDANVLSRVPAKYRPYVRDKQEWYCLAGDYFDAEDLEIELEEGEEFEPIYFSCEERALPGDTVISSTGEHVIVNLCPTHWCIIEEND